MQQKTFVDDKSFLNLEVGAGCGNFGQFYYPKCYLTDSDIELSKSCEICHIDWFCDVHSLTWKNSRFEKVIMCNPYRYGFLNSETTERLMAELLRILKNKNSQIIIISTKNNKFCSPLKVKKRINQFLETNTLVILDVLIEDIDTENEYVDYIFKDMKGNQINPSSKITIHVQQ